MEEVGKRKTRGLKWTDAEIKEMLKVAVDLNVNDLFDSHRMSSNGIYSKIGEKFKTKDVNQIKLKFDSLRRNFTAEKAEKQKSGGPGSIQTIYDSEMALLWGNRRKFTVPQEHGLDTSMIHANPIILDEVISDEDSSNANSNFSVSSRVSTASTSTQVLCTPSKKKRKNTDVAFAEYKEVSRNIMNEFKQMHQESEDKSDRRCQLVLDELKAIREVISARNYTRHEAPVFIQPPTPSPSVQEDAIDNNNKVLTYEVICEKLFEEP